MTNLNKRRLTFLLLEVRGELEYTVQSRQSTSTGNKDGHQKVLNALRDEDIESLEEALYDPWYFHKPLDGVIYCMDTSAEDKLKIIDAYNNIKGEMVWVQKLKVNY